LHTPFKSLAELCKKLEKTRSKKEKISLTVDFLKRLHGPEEVVAAANLLVGFHMGTKRAGLTIGPSTLYKALQEKVAVLGENSMLTIVEVWETLKKAERLKGHGSSAEKKALLTSLLSRADDVEREWLTRVVLGEMRHGLNVGLLLEALAHVAGKPIEEIRTLDMLSGGLDNLVKAFFEEKFEQIGLKLFNPVKPMLAEYVYSVEEVFKKLGRPVLCEPKIDGVRIQVHKKGDVLRVFSRGLKDITHALPDLVNDLQAALKAEKAVIDGEAYGVDSNGKPLPFQETMKRIGRERQVDSAVASTPITAKFFDIIYIDGEELWSKSLTFRRRMLESALEDEYVNPAVNVMDEAELDILYNRWVEEGFEGLMAKSPTSTYTPGRRGGYWVKLKHSETLDVVVAAAEWGHGRRRGLLSNYHLYVIDDRTGELVCVGKTFKGLTDDELRRMTEKLLSLKKADTEWGVIVEPKTVLEVEFNDIQLSPHYVSGYALRFARVKRIREDKSPEEADTLSKVEQLFKKLRRVNT